MAKCNCGCGLEMCSRIWCGALAADGSEYCLAHMCCAEAGDTDRPAMLIQPGSVNSVEIKYGGLLLRANDNTSAPDAARYERNCAKVIAYAKEHPEALDADPDAILRDAVIAGLRERGWPEPVDFAQNYTGTEWRNGDAVVFCVVRDKCTEIDFVAELLSKDSERGRIILSGIASATRIIAAIDRLRWVIGLPIYVRRNGTTFCGGPYDTLAEAQAAMAKHVAARSVMPACSGCGEPSPDGEYCVPCRERLQLKDAWSSAMRSAGLRAVNAQDAADIAAGNWKAVARRHASAVEDRLGGGQSEDEAVGLRRLPEKPQPPEPASHPWPIKFWEQD
jgi:hypothetical protein